MIPLMLLALVVSVLSSKEVCPGGSFTCPDYATCCQLADTSYGCCPMKNAVCCDDHIHCCPTKTRCDAGICIQLDGFNITAKKLTNDDKDIRCFGSESACPDDTTCCKGSKPGIYSCCPMEHAVCCLDGTHCCPEGTTCDLEAETCLGKGYISEMYDSKKNKVRKLGHAKYSMLTKANNVSNVICPGSSFQCPDGYTCCQLPDGGWGCCPYVEATCCPDHLHCCPENMKCDSTSQACRQGLSSISSVPKLLAEPVSVDLVCPDNTTCAESMTCCKMNRMHFGCCPYPDATCCADRKHCCPSGFTCDEEQKQCVPKLKGLFKQPAMFKYKKVNIF